MSVFDVLQERGFIKQMSHEAEIKELLEKEKITFYIGFDPTADSGIHRAQHCLLQEADEPFHRLQRRQGYHCQQC